MNLEVRHIHKTAAAASAAFAFTTFTAPLNLQPIHQPKPKQPQTKSTTATPITQVKKVQDSINHTALTPVHFYCLLSWPEAICCLTMLLHNTSLNSSNSITPCSQASPAA